MLLSPTTTPLFEEIYTRQVGVFPGTRYQGSKYKLLEWIKYVLKDISFNTALDAFGGTGSVSYLFKQMGKQVIYNDYLKFNSVIATALIENDDTELEDSTLDFILQRHTNINYPNVIQDTFDGIYYTRDENQWLDQTITNIKLIDDKYQQAIAYFALFQASIAKRPYNLFHRKNLYVRLAEVQRSFGNKKTWDTPFEDHFVKFVNQANAAVFNNGSDHYVFNEEIGSLSVQNLDLVYIDPPYINKKGVGVNYFEFYHFLEGLVDYDSWKEKIDYESKHLKLKNGKCPWSDKNQITQAFTNLIHKFKDSVLVISYRDDGIPSIPEIINILNRAGKNPKIYHAEYKYALSNNSNKEVLIVAE